MTIKTTQASEATVFITCVRCSGRGHMPEFQHIAGGTCFECAGARGRTVNVAERAAAAKRAKARLAADQRKMVANRAARMAEIDARETAVREAFPALTDAQVLYTATRDEMWIDGAWINYAKGL